MKNRFSIGIIFVLIILLIGVFGCMMNNPDLSNNTETKVSLNERQKSILAEYGLPTEYDELLLSQKTAIVAIEEMLCYAEEKYDISFSYAGYIAASPLEKEHMIAFPTSGNKWSDSFTITNNGDNYEDDYINVAINEEFTSYLCDNIKSFAPDAEVRVFPKITKTYFHELPSGDINYDGMVESSQCVFIDESTFNEEDLSKFHDQFTEFMQEHKLYGITQIILLKEGRIEYLTKYNYTDYLFDEHHISRETFYTKK